VLDQVHIIVVGFSPGAFISDESLMNV